MAHIITVTDLAHPGLAPYARLTERQLRSSTVEITVLRAQPQLSAMRVLLIPRLCSRRIPL